MRKIPVLTAYFAFCAVMFLFPFFIASAQIQGFGSQVAIGPGTNLTTPAQATNTFTIPVREITLSLSTTNTNSIFTGQVLLTFDNVNFITSGVVNIGPFTNLNSSGGNIYSNYNGGATTQFTMTNWPVSFASFFTNVPAYLYLKGNSGGYWIWASSFYGP